MADWNPSLYLQYETERSRPAAELLSRVALENGSTGLRPWLQELSESEQHRYLARYHALLQEQYPLQENGKILLAFPRLFIVAKHNS